MTYQAHAHTYTSALAYQAANPTKQDTKPMLKSVNTYSPFRSRLLDDSERPAMLEGIPRLLDILSWRRPHGSEAELEFMIEYLAPLGGHPNVSAYKVDDFGNIWVTVGANKSHPLLFSCHVDTVSSKGGRQAIGWSETEPDIICLVKRKAGRSLGADDGAGLWLLLEMIDAGQEGRYVFHRGEEEGRLGSRHVAKEQPELLEGVRACIAFDRRDHDNLITHQMGERGCSDNFAYGLIGAIREASQGALRYQLDDTGSYTDSYSYFDIVPECTNLSVGYDGEHGPRETLDAAHIWRLRNAMTQIDLSALVFERDPSVPDFHGYGLGYGSNSSINGDWIWDENDHCYHPAYRDDADQDYRPARKKAKSGFADASRTSWEDLAELESLVINYPMKAAELLQDMGMTSWEYIEALPSSEQGRALSTIGL